MMAAVTFSRRKMFSKVRVTEVVPAPDEPVMAMMGCLTDMAQTFSNQSIAKQGSLGKQRRVVFFFKRFMVVLLNPLYFVFRTKHQTNTLM